MAGPMQRAVVRELRAGESAALLDLFEAVLPGWVTNLVGGDAAPADFLDDPISFLLGAYVDGEPVGLAWGVQMRYPNGCLVTYLHELDVREPFRRRGIATALVEHAMALARANGSTKLWLSTDGHNDGAQALYESMDGVRKDRGDVNYWWELG
jgi:ribosomal protein S18 acetylase RimI-like enzyme